MQSHVGVFLRGVLMDLDKLRKRTWIYEVLKDIFSLVRETSYRDDHQRLTDRDAQLAACWVSIKRSGNMGRLQCEISLKPPSLLPAGGSNDTVA